LRTELKKIKLPDWLFAGILLWVSVLSFGIMIPWMGLYADDWPFYYVNQLRGFNGVVEFIAWVRPFAGWMFGLITALTGKSFWAAHVILLLLRWADALLFWRFLRLIWPGQPQPARWAALIFAVFPAFKQQPLSLEYFPHFLILGLYFLSAVCMLKAAEKPDRFWYLHIPGWFCGLSIFSVEYFFGQEFLRPVLLWLVLRRGESDHRKLIKRTFLNWLPYLLNAGVFLYWRVFVQKFPTYQPELMSNLAASPGAALMELSRQAVSDLWTVGAGTWLQVLEIPSGLKTLGLSLVVAMAAFLPTLIFLRMQDMTASEKVGWNKGNKAAFGWVGLGLLSMFLAGWPFWITRLPIRLTFPWDRATLAFIIGASIFIAGMVQLPRSRKGQAVFLAALVGLSAGTHFQNANQFRKEWEAYKSFYWQLAWRAPGLVPGTTLVLDNSPFNFHTDKFLVPTLNETYTPDNDLLELPYSLHEFYKLWGSVIPSDQPVKTVTWKYGTLSFTGEASGLLMIAYEPPGCLRLLGPGDGSQMLFSQDFRDGLADSRLERVLVAPESPARPPDYLGLEPTNTWCYYFEKADLARQAGDWDNVVRLGDEARKKGLKAGYPSEWLVFIEGYIYAGRMNEAVELSDAILGDEFFRASVCQVWDRAAKSSLANEEIKSSTTHLKCGF